MAAQLLYLPCYSDGLKSRNHNATPQLSKLKNKRRRAWLKQQNTNSKQVFTRRGLRQMKKLSRLSLPILAASALLVILVISGCATKTPEVIHLKPECSVPVRAELPQVDAGELWYAVGAETYDKLADRERLIVDWAREMQLMLTAICAGE